MFTILISAYFILSTTSIYLWSQDVSTQFLLQQIICHFFLSVPRVLHTALYLPFKMCLFCVEFQIWNCNQTACFTYRTFIVCLSWLLCHIQTPALISIMTEQLAAWIHQWFSQVIFMYVCVFLCMYIFPRMYIRLYPASSSTCLPHCLPGI